MVEDIIKKRLKQSISKEIVLHRKSTGFRYWGKITNCDDKYVEILDYSRGRYNTIPLDDIESYSINDEEVKQ